MQTAGERNNFPKCGTTNRKFEIYTDKEIHIDKLPNYRIGIVPETYNQAMLETGKYRWKKMTKIKKSKCLRSSLLIDTSSFVTIVE